MRVSTLLAVVLLTAAPLGAQRPESVARAGAIVESYSFGDGLTFDRVSQLVIPVSLFHRFGARVGVDLASGYASSAVRTLGGELDVSGPIDTDVRASWAPAPGRLVLTLVGTLPTGTETVPDTTLPLYGATATDLFGFTVPALGAGGGVTAGFATAFRLGSAWAVGTGASYRYNASYVPVRGGGELSPGAEGRVRFGIEGPLGRTYIRGALVLARSGADEVASAPASIIGDRVLAYATLNMPLGRGALSLYAWEMRRLRPRGYSTTYSAAAKVPRGNVFALGARLDRPLSPAWALAPTLELRHEMSGTTELEVLGYLVRPGVEVRYRTSDRAAVVGHAQLAVGQLRDEGIAVSVLGPRLGVMLEWTR